MKKTKRILALVLTLVMMLSLAVPAFADTGKDYYNYRKYMCVGDSIASGCGLTKSGEETQFDQNSDHYWLVYGDDYIYHGYGYVPVPNAYHSLVAEALDADLLQCAVSGLRAVEFRYVLDGVYNDFDETRYWGNVFFDWDGNGFTIEDIDSFICDAMDYPAKIKEADVMSLNLGSNDVFSFSLNCLTSFLGDTSMDPALQEIKDSLAKTGDMGAALGKLIDLYSTMGKVSELVAELVTTLTKACNQYFVNYTAVMDKIYEINPDITVVNVGVFNPMRYFRLSSDMPLDISGIMEPVVTQMNSFLKSLSWKYDNCYYADVTDTETYPMSYNDPLFWEYFTLKVHPNLAGHQYMAKQIISVLPTAEPTSFNDVKSSDWFWDDVAYCSVKGLMNGVSAKTFDPQGTSTRGQFVTVLYRMAGSPDVSGLENPFKDVSSGAYYHDAVVWAYNEGVIKGVSATQFAPEAAVTRAQLVTMLYRYAGSPEVSGKLGFTDSADVAACYRDAVIWASENGIVNGYPDGSFKPNANMTRAEMAAVLNRYCHL